MSASNAIATSIDLQILDDALRMIDYVQATMKMQVLRDNCIVEWIEILRCVPY